MPFQTDAFQNDAFETGGGGPTGYVAAVQADSPTAYWRMGEASGLPQDSVGTNHMTTSAGTLTYNETGAITSDDDGAIRISGGAFTAPDATALDLGDGPFTIELWVKRAGGVGSQQVLIGKNDGSNVNNPVITFETDNTVAVYKAGVGLHVKSTVSISDTTTWHHIVLTRDGTPTTKLYIDGVDRTGTVTAQTFASNGAAFRVGSDPGPSLAANAAFDEIAVYQTALSPTRVTAHFDAATAAPGVEAPAIPLAITPVDPGRFDQTVAPAAIALAVAESDPVLTLDVVPGALGLTLGALAPAQFDLAATPGALPLSLGQPAPAGFDITMAPGALALLLDQPAPGRFDLTAELPALGMTMAAEALQRFDLGVDPPALVLSPDLLAPARFDQAVTPDAVATATSTPPPDIAAADGQVSPGAMGLTIDPAAAGVELELAPDPLPATLDAQVPGGFDLTAALDALGITLSPVAPTRFDLEVVPTAGGLVVTPVAPGSLDQSIPMVAIDMALALPAPSVAEAGAQVVSPDPQGFAATAVAPGEFDLTLDVPALTASLAAPAPAPTPEVGVPAAGLISAVLSPALGLEVAPAIETLTVTVLGPVLGIGIEPTPVAIGIDAPTPVRLDGEVIADLIALAIAAMAPTFDVGGAVVVVGGQGPVGVAVRFTNGGRITARVIAPPSGTATHPKPEA